MAFERRILQNLYIQVTRTLKSGFYSLTPTIRPTLLKVTSRSPYVSLEPGTNRRYVAHVSVIIGDGLRFVLSADNLAVDNL